MRGLFKIAFFIFPIILNGQDIHFSQFSKSTFFLNPSLLSSQESENKIVLQRRNQWESVAIPFSTFTLSLEKKEVFLNNSFGVQLLNDVAGDAKFRTQGASIIFSRGIKFNKLKFNIGVLLGRFQRSIFYDKLIFNSSENLQNTSFWFNDISIGASIISNTKSNKPFNTGFSIYHLNQPNQSLTNTQVKLNKKYNFYIFTKYELIENTSFSPKIFLSKQSQDIELITSLDFDYVFKNKPELNLTFGLGNRWGDALIYSVGTKLNEFEFGFSYDYNISSLSKASNNDGGFEIILLYTWDIKKPDVKRNKTIKPCPKYL